MGLCIMLLKSGALAIIMKLEVHVYTGMHPYMVVYIQLTMYMYRPWKFAADNGPHSRLDHYYPRSKFPGFPLLIARKEG